MKWRYLVFIDLVSMPGLVYLSDTVPDECALWEVGVQSCGLCRIEDDDTGGGLEDI